MKTYMKKTHWRINLKSQHKCRYPELIVKLWSWFWTGEDVDVDGQYEDGEDDEEDDRVYQNGRAIGGEAAEFNMAGFAR